MSNSVTNKWTIFWVGVAVIALTIMDISKVNVALPSIEHAFETTPTQLQFIVSGYILTFGLMLVPMGRLGDQISRKNLYLIGITIFTLASVIAALAADANTLMIARMVQGVAAGIQAPQVIGTIQEVFQGRERGKAFGYFGAAIGIGTAIGPTLAGVLIQVGGAHDGWRNIFWVNVPLGIAVFILIWVLFPSGKKVDANKVDLDPFGTVIFGIAVLCLLWPFLFTTGDASDDPNRWWVLAPFVVTMVIFIFWERYYASRGHDPLIPLHLFKIKSFTSGITIAGIYFTSVIPLFVLSSVYLQLGPGLTPLMVGLVSISFAVSNSISSAVAGNFVHKYGNLLVLAGMIVVLFGFVGMILAAEYLSNELIPWVFSAAMFVSGFGGGMVVSPNQTLTLSEIRVVEGGLAGAVGQLIQRIGSAVGAAIVLAVFYASINTSEASIEIASGEAFTHSMLVMSGLLLAGLVVCIIEWRRSPSATDGL
ncbi:MAG: MFS transporter [Microbacteriaceae bacterium]|nr:MFS transporter [Microbacteriaceae bacterium]